MSSDNVPETKVCTKCGAVKPLTLEFFSRRGRKQAHLWASWCRKCSCAGRYKSKGCVARTPEMFAARFWSKVDKNGPTQDHTPELGPCWIWTGYTNKSGYGEVGRRAPRRVECTHRVAWELTRGESAGELCVLHRCDHPPCCNPTHLFLGTRTENMNDKVRKGRQHRGEQHAHAILTEDLVRDIRSLRFADRMKIREIAEFLGVTEGAVGSVCDGTNWRHVS